MRPIRGACSELLVVRHLSRPSRQSMIQMCLLIFTDQRNWTIDLDTSSAARWMEDLLCGQMAKETTMEDMAAIFQVCWAIWKARNACVFTGKSPLPGETIEAASVGFRDYLHALYRAPNPCIPQQFRTNKWTPPPPPLLKFNSDGAYKSSRSVAAFGVIARDCGGSAQFWRTDKVMVASALAIEAWALRIACEIAKDMNLSEAIFESDCLELINCFTIPTATRPWEIRAVIEDIVDWARNRNWTFSWCPRKMNKVAHWLATNCLNRRFVFSSGCIPPDLHALLNSDVRSWFLFM